MAETENGQKAARIEAFARGFVGRERESNRGHLDAVNTLSARESNETEGEGSKRGGLCSPTRPMAQTFKLPLLTLNFVRRRRNFSLPCFHLVYSQVSVLLPLRLSSSSRAGPDPLFSHFHQRWSDSPLAEWLLLLLQLPHRTVCQEAS